ncbi:protein HHL1, chloroplastic isoform X3 [Ricinus communis]|uniref:protein HHL1, chloroplastic isoform X3 n=1 Tax=Ricinus communis TaxID=3988 RepID=UPI0007726596|nr:protein HHL1, chloroplastic isoform X3 [Ricinus communis]|eukprot:XP_015572261.1 protein HHL1, chloroplastic isoform X3 [Ricinus communis]
MEVGLSLNALVRLPLSNSSRIHHEDGVAKHTLFSTRTVTLQKSLKKQTLLVVKAKGKRGMQSRQFQRPPAPSLPKIEDDGNPKFLIFIRMANVYLWYPLSLVTGGTTAKIMVAAKDNFLGKYIYKNTLDRNLAAVIYRENGNVRAALSTTDVIELPTPDQLKTVVDKVKDFFGDAKESFGKLTALDSTTDEPEEVSKEKAKVKG